MEQEETKSAIVGVARSISIVAMTKTTQKDLGNQRIEAQDNT